MRLTRRLATGRGRLSLRSRLLAGLLTVTALFLVVMGVVTTVVLGNSEQGQFNSDLVLATRVRLSQLSGLQGYAVAYYDANTRTVTPVPPSSTDLTELQQYLTSLATDQEFRAFRAQNPAGTLFGITEPGEPPLTAIWRLVTPKEADGSQGALPAGDRKSVV